MEFISEIYGHFKITWCNSLQISKIKEKIKWLAIAENGFDEIQHLFIF